MRSKGQKKRKRTQELQSAITASRTAMREQIVPSKKKYRRKSRHKPTYHE